MAHHASAKKRIRQEVKRRHSNRLIIATLRTQIKRFRAAVAVGDKVEAGTLLPGALSGLDQAVTKGCMHRKTASRKISRLSLVFSQME